MGWKSSYREYTLADAVVRTFLLSIMSAACFYSAVWMAQDIFTDWTLSQNAYVWVCASAVFTALLYELGIRAIRLRGLQIVCGLLVPAAYAWVLFRYYEQHRIDLEDGACALGTQFLEKFNLHLKTTFAIWIGRAELRGLAFAFYTLTAVLLVLVFAAVFRRRELLLLLPAGVFFAELLIGYVPQWKGLALFFAALMLVHADGWNGRRTALRVHIDKKQRHARTWLLPWLSAVCVAAAAIGILLCAKMLSDLTNERLLAAAPGVQTFQKKAEQGISSFTRGYVLPRQEEVNNKTPHYTGKEMLRVTASQCPAEDMLLKGFCGTDYLNGSWVYDKQKFADACAQAGADKKEAAHELLQAQYDLYAHGEARIQVRYAFGGVFSSMNSNNDVDRVEYTIEHTGISSRYAFLPYASDHVKNFDKERLIGDASLRKSWLQDTFTYSGWSRFTGGITLDSVLDETEPRVFDWYDDFAKKAYQDTSKDVPTINEYLSEMQQGELHLDDNLLNLKDYKNWLALLYLQHETDLVDGAVWCNQNRLQKALVVSATLKRYQTYSMVLDELPEGEDPVAYFLLKSGKGYCVHFASAAVLMLRELGVPARYASGYVVRRRQFRKKGDVYVASIKDSGAHAWVEIYLEQIGWVPIDVTPGAALGQNAANGQIRDTDAADDDEIQTDIDDLEDEQMKEDETQTDTDDTKTDDASKKENAANTKQQSGVYRVWQRYRLWIIYAAAALSLLLALAGCRRAVRLYCLRPKREIQEGKCSKAVRRINTRIYRRMRMRVRMPQRRLSDAQYEQMLNRIYQEIQPQDWAYFMRTALAAAFAQEEVSAQDAWFCWEIYSRIRRRSGRRR